MSNHSIKPVFTVFFLWFLPLVTTARNYTGNIKNISTASFLFIENKGQITDEQHDLRVDIDYKLETPGLNIFIGKGKIYYQWVRERDSSNRLDLMSHLKRSVEM